MGQITNSDNVYCRAILGINNEIDDCYDKELISLILQVIIYCLLLTILIVGCCGNCHLQVPSVV